MNRKVISLIIAAVVVGIIIVIVIDYRSSQPDKLGKNPYKYDYEEYKTVDPLLIGYKETKNFPIKNDSPGAIDYADGLLWLAGSKYLQSITTMGVPKMKVPLSGEVKALEVTSHGIYIAYEDHVKKYSKDGEIRSTWASPGLNCVLTSLSAGDDVLYVADAGNRRVLRYDFEGTLLGEFEGKSESSAGHGFIVPSANFDLVVNAYGELWVINPGKHAIENYSSDGEMRGFWQKGSMSIDGFSGCCNPTDIAVLNDGSFITSEKGLVRIKIYNASGELKTVVAAPEKFEEEGLAPEIIADENDVIYALDFDRNTVRVFEKI